MIPSTTSKRAARQSATVDAPCVVRGQRRPATRRRTSQDHRGVLHSSLTDIDGGPRRATQDHSIFLSLQSDCIARLNSIRFRHDDPDRYDDSSYSGDDSHVGSKGMEVMDLRPSAHLRDLEDSSLISLTSNNSNDSELASGLKLANGLFPVVGSGGGGGDAPLRDNLPKHWVASGDGESDHSYRAIIPLMRSDDNDNKGSFVSWSGLVAPPGDGSSKLWDGLKSSSKSTQSSPLTDKKKMRQRRRFARAIVGLMALAALSGSVSYFVSEKDYRSVYEFLLVNNFLGRLLGSDNNNAEEHQEEKDDQQIYRMLPKGGNVVEMVPTPPSASGYLGNDHYDKEISQQERARGQLILAHEHHVRAQQEARAQEERTTGRKTMTQDEGYHNGVHQDYPTAHQDHNLVDERWNDPYREYHQEYNRYPPMEEGRRALTQEDEGQYNVHQDNPVHEDYPENFVPRDGIDHQDGGWIQGWWTRM